MSTYLDLLRQFTERYFLRDNLIRIGSERLLGRRWDISRRGVEDHEGSSLSVLLCLLLQARGLLRATAFYEVGLEQFLGVDFNFWSRQYVPWSGMNW